MTDEPTKKRKGRKNLGYVLQKQTEGMNLPAKWEEVPTTDGPKNIYEMQKFIRDNNLEGTFRVLAIRANFSVKIVKKSQSIFEGD